MLRIHFRGSSVEVWAFPSRGGVIILERATLVDMDFLGLDSVHLSLIRDPDQDAEDRFCQQLLRLGAKWYDSVKRYQFVLCVADDDEDCVDEVIWGTEEKLTAMERRWVCVGIASGGGFWVGEYDTVAPFVQDKDNLEPGDSTRVLLARTMDERCEILKGMGAKFYENIEQ